MNHTTEPEFPDMREGDKNDVGCQTTKMSPLTLIIGTTNRLEERLDKLNTRASNRLDPILWPTDPKKEKNDEKMPKVPPGLVEVLEALDRVGCQISALEDLISRVDI